MSNIESLSVVYDRGSDVLYINTRRELAARGIEDRNGIVWRYDRHGRLIGATVLDFRDRWFDQAPLLAGELSRRFHISESQAMVVVERAAEGR
jgi:Protein of unknown function (DUF2283)